MKELQTIVVDDISYDVNPYITSVGMKLLTDITLLAGKPLLTLIFGIKGSMGKGKKFTEMDIDADLIQTIMTGLYERIDTNTLDSLFKRVLSGTMISNSSQSLDKIYDTHFQSRYLHLFKVVLFSLKVQYADFWKGLSGNAAVAQVMNRL